MCTQDTEINKDFGYDLKSMNKKSKMWLTGITVSSLENCAQQKKNSILISFITKNAAFLILLLYAWLCHFLSYIQLTFSLSQVMPTIQQLGELHFLNSNQRLVLVMFSMCEGVQLPSSILNAKKKNANLWIFFKTISLGKHTS